MKLALFSIAFSALSIVILDVRYAIIAMIVPFIVNVVLMFRMIRSWIEQKGSDFYHSDVFRWPFIHLISWFALTFVLILYSR